MASKKESEGIRMLSMYGDEDDEEMEDIKDEGNLQSEEEGEEQKQVGDDYMECSDREVEIRVSSDRAVLASDSGNNKTPQLSVENNGSSPHQQREFAAEESRRSRKERLTIVDYGHDELAMSPEPEVLVLTHYYCFLIECLYANGVCILSGH